MPDVGDHEEKNKRQRRIVAGLLLLALLMIGFGLYRDYGISWDEPVQRRYGEMVYNYLAEGDETLLVDRHRVYGPVFEVLLYSVERGLGLEDLRDIYFMRHLLTFLMFALGAAFFFLLSARILKDWRMGLLGGVLLILSPRILSHAFYNSKDIPFMAMFVVCVYTLLLHLDGKSVWMSLVHGVCCAILVDIRIGGVFVPLITLALFIHELSAEKRAGVNVSRTALSFGAFIAPLVALTILLWPILWSQPVANFISAIGAMRKFTWTATVLFMGKEIWSTDLPPYYTAVWILITTPVMYVILSFMGIAAALLRVAGKGGGWAVTRRDALLVLVWLFVPLVSLVASGAVLYDTWRHTFFVYPAMLLLALMGLGRAGDLARLVPGTRMARVFVIVPAVLLAVDMSGVAAFMVRSHPHQNVYFNALVGGVRGAAGEYEMDYWGLSYRRLLESLLEKDGRDAISVHALNEPGYYNSFILPPEERRRLNYTEHPASADYYMTNFRWERTEFPEGAEFAGVEVYGVILSAAYRVR